MSLHNIMESSHQLSQLNSVPQQVSALSQHLVPSAYQFNSLPTSTGLCLCSAPHVGGSLPPAASSQRIHPLPLNPSFPGPSRLPPQGLIHQQRRLHMIFTEWRFLFPYTVYTGFADSVG